MLISRCSERRAAPVGRSEADSVSEDFRLLRPRRSVEEQGSMLIFLQKR